MSKYDRLWTIRGTVDVADDIYLLPADQLRIVQSPTDGTHRIVMLRGDRVWETCVDLTERPGADASIAKLPARTSASLTDGGSYHHAVRVFLTGGPDPNAFRRLCGMLYVAGSKAEVTVWTPKCPTSGREILIIKVSHVEGQSRQNGTGHGDWD